MSRRKKSLNPAHASICQLEPRAQSIGARWPFVQQFFRCDGSGRAAAERGSVQQHPQRTHSSRTQLRHGRGRLMPICQLAGWPNGHVAGPPSCQSAVSFAASFAAPFVLGHDMAGLPAVEPRERMCWQIWRRRRHHQDGLGREGMMESMESMESMIKSRTSNQDLRVPSRAGSKTKKLRRVAGRKARSTAEAVFFGSGRSNRRNLLPDCRELVRSPARSSMRALGLPRQEPGRNGGAGGAGGAGAPCLWQPRWQVRSLFCICAVPTALVDWQIGKDWSSQSFLGPCPSCQSRVGICKPRSTNCSSSLTSCLTAASDAVWIQLCSDQERPLCFAFSCILLHSCLFLTSSGKSTPSRPAAHSAGNTRRKGSRGSTLGDLRPVPRFTASAQESADGPLGSGNPLGRSLPASSRQANGAEGRLGHRRLSWVMVLTLRGQPDTRDIAALIDGKGMPTCQTDSLASSHHAACLLSPGLPN
ncbi:hypothetical protein AOQ84DRAFT_443059 [Glonium stellatum]|uniref:Uncharacterized protein n=1 Tax=Glonium stellatum TaxID=574774 RepID=A0A8E2EQA5_9PEZI|nr:hypothetical protein AOQ84DRAFT_443059 [Glonium stellatum]